MRADRTAAVLTVGTEITAGLRLDTNTRDIAFTLLRAGYDVAETVSLPDDFESVVTSLGRLVAHYELVVVTGGLGPTHDDITREAAAQALGLQLIADASMEKRLLGWADRQGSPEASLDVMRQALVLAGGRIIPPSTGTAPGQAVPTARGGVLLLLPGPPHEMFPMLEQFFRGTENPGVVPRELSCTGITESDAQFAAQAVLATHPGVTLALLAKPADIRVVLFDAGAGASGLDAAAAAVRHALGEACYADDGSSLAEVVIHAAESAGLFLATAESCTGGMVAEALTSVPGSSACFRGGAIAYSNAVKTSLLGVSPGTLTRYGAVSARTAEEMACGAAERLGADIAVSVTGIAGPSGGDHDKPVGLVWFGVATKEHSETVERHFPGDRDGVRERATIAALDLLRRTLARM